MTRSEEIISTRPVTAKDWSDLEDLFGPRGACGGCWCMWWRLAYRDYEATKGEANRRLLEGRVKEGPAPGVRAYTAGRPVGWCAIARREEFVRLRTSRLFKPLDDQHVWSITYLFVAVGDRGRGVGEKLIRGALVLAAVQGGRIVEAYAVAPPKRTAPVFLSSGVVSLYKKVGFETFKQPSPTRHLMRFSLR